MPRSLIFIATLAGLLVACSPDKQAQGKDDTSAAVRGTQWSSEISITYGDGSFRYRSNSQPNHHLNDEYVMPDNFSTCVPHPTTACTHIEPASEAISDVAVDVTITTRPLKVEKTASIPLQSTIRCLHGKLNAPLLPFLLPRRP